MKIDLPSSWDDVTVEEWQAVRKLIKDGPDSDPYLLECAIISTLSGADMDELLRLSRGSHAIIMETLSFLKEPIEGKVKTFERVGKQRYYFEKRAENITGGQYIDLMHYLKQDDKVDENLHLLVACFTHKMKWGLWKQDYNGKELNEVADAVKKMPITTIKPLTDFFLQHYLICASDTVAYLERQAQKLKRQAEKELKRSSQDGDGSMQSTASQTDVGSYGSITKK